MSFFINGSEETAAKCSPDAGRRVRGAGLQCSPIQPMTPPAMPNAIPAVMHYVVAREPGPPEVLALAEAATPAPKPGEVLIEVDYAGVNRPDCIQRAGHYPPPPMPRRSSDWRWPAPSSRWARASPNVASATKSAR